MAWADGYLNKYFISQAGPRGYLVSYLKGN